MVSPEARLQRGSIIGAFCERGEARWLSAILGLYGPCLAEVARRGLVRPSHGSAPPVHYFAVLPLAGSVATASFGSKHPLAVVPSAFSATKPPLLPRLLVHLRTGSPPPPRSCAITN